MILERKGQILQTSKNVFEIGKLVLANNESTYSGKVGLISKIKTGYDKATDNEGPDIYIDFNGDVVIMSESMLISIPENYKIVGNKCSDCNFYLNNELGCFINMPSWNKKGKCKMRK